MKKKKTGKKISMALTAVSVSAIMGMTPAAVFAEKGTAASSSSSSPSDPGTGAKVSGQAGTGSEDGTAQNSSSGTTAGTGAVNGSEKGTVTDPAGQEQTSADGQNGAKSAPEDNGKADTGTSAEEDAAKKAAEEAKKAEEEAKKKEEEQKKAAEEAAKVSDEDASREAQEENEDKPKSTNEALVAAQHIVHIAPVESGDSLRFYTVDRVTAYAKNACSILEDKKDSARAVGSLDPNDTVYTLQDDGDGWVYVESGPVRGFVKASDLAQGDEAQALASADGFVTGFAKILVPVSENAAYLYSKASTYSHVVPKKYVTTSRKDVNVRADKNTDATLVGKFTAGDLAYLLADEGDWAYIESGNVRGFVKKEFLTIGEEADNEVAAKGEENYSEAKQLLDPSKNVAFYHTYTSVTEDSKTHRQRVAEAILKTAESCIGNPYVWGGVSLTNGCDCSGFVQTLFAQYGIGLPRVAAAQSQFGTQIPVADAEAGDLIFYAKDGYVYHVSLCIGNGQDIEAYGTDYGIIRNTIDTAHAVWATRVIPES